MTDRCAYCLEVFRGHKCLQRFTQRFSYTQKWYWPVYFSMHDIPTSLIPLYAKDTVFTSLYKLKNGKLKRVWL